MKLIFYKAPGTIWDKLIRWRTGSKYSHCEILFDSTGQCFSASARENLVRFKTFYIEPDKWDIVDLPNMDEQLIYAWCKTVEGSPYDWSGVIGFILPFIKQSKKRWFCSEVCTAALQQDGWLAYVNPYTVDPGDLYALVKRDNNA